MTHPVLPLQDSEQTRLLRRTVSDVCRPFGHEYFLRASRQRTNARELWLALGGAGLLGVAIPEEYGGGGGGLSDLAVVTEEVAAAGCPLMLLALSPAVCATTLLAHGTDRQKADWLPPLASGESVMAFANTEPEAGSNTHRITTTATAAGGGWRLAGHKYYVSHVDNAQAILVVARVAADGDARLGLFVVEADRPGLSRAEIDVEITSPERQWSLWFDDVALPGDALIGEPGLEVLFTGLNPERIASAALLCGIARYALARGCRYACERSVWDVPVGAHQAIAHPLARAAVATELARLMTAKAAALHDAGLPAGETANMAKLAASEAAAGALDAAIQAHGGNGMATEYGLATLLGLTRLFRIAPVSTEMVLNQLSRRTLGLPKSY